MILHRPSLTMLAVLLTALACTNAKASWSEPYDDFVSRYRTDIPLERYQAGQLGVVLPSYVRSHLYTAWRDVMLGERGLSSAPNPARALADVEARRRGGWQSYEAGKAAYLGWRQAVSKALTQDNMPSLEADKVAGSYLNCPVASYTFATSTLDGLRQRADATPARLAAWVASQRQVFRICGDDPEQQRSYFEKPKTLPAALAPLADGEALYWRQVQQYQLASAAFYAADYGRSTALFSTIGATAGHPFQSWGEYLSLRSQARAATYRPGTDQQRWQAQIDEAREGPAAAAARLARQQEKLTVIMAAVARIVANPALAQRHEDSRAIGRAMQARLTPAARFAQLSKLLDDPRNNPYLDDHLGDWLTLADQLLVPPVGDKTDLRDAMREQTGFLDWIQTLQQCHDYQPRRSCAQEQAHALAQWQRFSRENNAAQIRVWLMAAAMLAGRMTPELEQASLKVAPGAPEYLTVRLALARHYRLDYSVNQQAAALDKARTLSEAALAAASLAASQSTAAHNLFLQERFAVSTSPQDAVPYLLRQRLAATDHDTGEQADRPVAKPAKLPELAADGGRWLNSGLAAADLYALGADQRLPQQLRARLGVAAWMRFELLGQQEAALQAARQVAQNNAVLAPVMRAYQAASATERRHLMLLAAVRHNLLPTAGMERWPSDYATLPADESTASMWCKLPAKAGAPYEENTEAEQSVPMPDIGDRLRRDQELAQLGALKTATGYLGDHVLQRAATAPNDPDLPWLLHVVVRSTRGGCLDDDAKVLSRKAFTLLHKRYGKSEWAKKTPYFY